MCNLSDEIEERGIRKGIAQGIAQGKQEGIAQGIEQGTVKTMLANIRNLMDTMSLTVEQAMTALKVPENEQPEYIQLLNKQ